MIIDEVVEDLQTMSSSDIDTLLKFHGLTDRNLEKIAVANIEMKLTAKMPGKTYNTNQIGAVIDYINNQSNGRNICQRGMLVVTHYTRNPSNFYSTVAIDIKQQPIDIDTLPIISSDNPYPLLHAINKTKVDRYCFFVTFVQRDSSKPELPVLYSHITMVMCERNSKGGRDVYKYNSGFHDPKVEEFLDRSIVEFFALAANPGMYNIIPTVSWCPMGLQGKSNLCTVFVFNIYHHLNKYPERSIKDIIDGGYQDMDQIKLFLAKLMEHIEGAGRYTISFY